MRQQNRTLIAPLSLLVCISLIGFNAAAAERESESAKPESPWLATPTISSTPKSGSSVGAMAAYIHSFDKDSPASMFGAVGSYSTTNSYKYGVFARTHFDADNQRLSLGLAMTRQIQ